MAQLSIIIPTLNEAHHISACVKSCLVSAPSAEIIVVDGGSIDSTPEIAKQAGARVVRSARGRGIQCNAGAKTAVGSYLLFLHADSIVSKEAGMELARLIERPAFQIGTFRLCFDRESKLLSLYAAFTRFDSVWTSFGDQGIAVRSDFFEEIGCFPEWPLFEDVALLQSARRRTKIHAINATVSTSARRFNRLGLIRTQLLNGWLIIKYLLGSSPESLALTYNRIMRDSQEKRTSEILCSNETKTLTEK